MISNKLFFSKFNLIEFLLFSFFYFFSNHLYFSVNPVVNYMYKLNINFSIQYTIFNYLLLLFVYFCLPKRQVIERFFLLVLILSILVPTLVISNHTSTGIWVNFILSFSVCFILFLIKYFDLYELNVTFKKFVIKKSFFFIFFVFLSLLFLFFYFFLKVNSLDDLNIFNTFENIYDIREDNRPAGFLSYISNWVISLFVPVLLSNFFLNKSYLSLFISFLLVFFSFQFFAMKAHFFSFFLLLFFGCVYEFFPYVVKYSLYIFYSLIFFLSIVFGDLGFAFLDRFFYIIGLLNHKYFEFFISHPFNFFNGSKLGFLNFNPFYSKGVGFVIDDFYFGSGGSNASTGFLAAIFSEIGFLGVFFGIILTYFVIFIIKVLYNKFNVLGFLFCIQFSFLIMNTPLTDIFLSYGFVFVIFFSLISYKSNLTKY